MKKFLLSCCFFLIAYKVQAIEENVWTDEVINDQNVQIKDSEIRYKWYKESIVNSTDYYVEGESDEEYPYINYDDFLETEWSDWEDSKPVAKTNRSIEYKMVNRYRTLKPIRYLFLENVQGGYTTFKVSELKILISNNPINFSMQCNDCSTNFNYYVTNDSLSDSAYINNKGSLFIDLGNYYLIGDIRLELYMFDATPNTKKFDLYYSDCTNLEECNYAHKEIDVYVVSSNFNQPEKHLIIPDATFIENPVWDD